MASLANPLAAWMKLDKPHTSSRVRLIERSDQAALATVLAQAFQNDPVLRWMIPDDEEYDRVAIPYFALNLKQSQSFRSNYTNEHQSAVALWTAPEDYPTWHQQLFSTLQLVWILKGNMSRAFRLQELMSSYRPRKGFLHLNYLATEPAHQGKGLGGALIKPILAKAMSDDIPVYLECSNQRNLDFYRQFGFRLVDDIRLQDGPTIWPMTLEPARVKIPL